MPFEKGKSGNPAGRPKRKNTFKTLLKSLPDDVRRFQHPEHGELEPEELAALMLVEAAGNGESWAIKDLLDRMMGKAHQTTENTNVNVNAGELETGEALDRLKSTELGQSILTVLEGRADASEDGSEEKSA